MEEKFYINFFKQYNIDLTKDKEIIINNIRLPNFYLYNKKLIDLPWEFCHLLYKNYSSLLKNGYVHYENNFYKITSDDIVFDCGANMGIFAAYAASQGAEVYAFEPMSYIRQLLKDTAEFYPNIHIIPYALGNKNEQTKFNQCFNPGGSHNSLLKDENKENPILYQEKVQAITLDTFINENKIYPTFIKADIEGSELFLLEGGKKFLSQNKPIISMAVYHFNNNYNEIIDYIKKINFLYDLIFYKEEENQLYLFGK